MSGDDPVWNADSAEDAGLAELERALARYRWRGAPPPAEAFPPRRRRRAWAPALAAAALIALGVLLWRAGSPRRGASPYRVEVLAGALEQAHDELAPGDRLVCDDRTRVRVRVADIGAVELAPSSRLRVGAPAREGASDADYLLHLEGGELEASIFAAPRLFQLGTPAGIAVDLGCMYTARVDAEGSTTLSVTAGLVSFETGGRRVLVPAGASTVARPGAGPGTPSWDDAPAELRALLERLDAGAAPTRDDLERLAGLREERDSLTLWHLLRSPRADVRAAAYDALAGLVPPPEEVTRAGCLSGDVDMLDAWRAELSWDW
jgi:ferric-dicitrate binding protein FerR (iron transport regulator)